MEKELTMRWQNVSRCPGRQQETGVGGKQKKATACHDLMEAVVKNPRLIKRG